MDRDATSQDTPTCSGLVVTSASSSRSTCTCGTAMYLLLMRDKYFNRRSADKSMLPFCLPFAISIIHGIYSLVNGQFQLITLQLTNVSINSLLATKCVAEATACFIAVASLTSSTVAKAYNDRAIVVAISVRSWTLMFDRSSCIVWYL